MGKSEHPPKKFQNFPKPQSLDGTPYGAAPLRCAVNCPSMSLQKSKHICYFPRKSEETNEGLYDFLVVVWGKVCIFAVTLV